MKQSSFNSLGQLLKNKEALFEQLTQPTRWLRSVPLLIIASVVGLAVFGLVVGLYVPQWQHSLTLAWKMIVLVWGSVVICAPALYVFGTIRGSRITLPQLLFLLAGALATSAIVLLSLAPLTAFFTWSAPAGGFLRVMNAIFIGLSVAFGLFFLAQGMLYIHRQRKAAGQTSKAAVDIIVLWLILLIVVLVQMSWRLGPWYELRAVPVEYRMGYDFMFPNNPQGQFMQEPVVQTNSDGTQQVVWAIPEECSVNTLEYVEAGFRDDNGKSWTDSTAGCAWEDNAYRCSTIPLKLKKNTKFRAQVKSQSCVTNNVSIGDPGLYISQPFDLHF